LHRGWHQPASDGNDRLRNGQLATARMHKEYVDSRCGARAANDSTRHVQRHQFSLCQRRRRRRH